MPPKKPRLKKPPLDPSRKLVNEFTVGDARYWLHIEGGELAASEFVYQLISIAAVAALTARAIWVGHATVWHLALTMVAQYLALIATVPALYAVTRHLELRKQARNFMLIWAGLAAAVAIATAARSRLHETTFQEQFVSDAGRCWNWIANAEMHWPILLAFLGMTLAVRGRVRRLVTHGPPFVGLPMGCGLRLLVLVPGCLALPLAWGHSTWMAWFLWAIILVGELFAVWMHWDTQRLLRQVEPLADAKEKPGGVA